MGLLQKACETYDSFAHLAGVEREGFATLAPISHLPTAADVEIVLDQNGALLDIVTVGKQEGKIIIPVTTESAGRAGKVIAPHPLCDQLGYLAAYNAEKFEAYVKQLEDWNNSPCTHPKLGPVLTYVKSGRILQDLEERGYIKLDDRDRPDDEKLFVRWRVLGIGEASGPCWTDRSLFDAFTSYYTQQRREEATLCMVTGEMAAPAEQHPKGVVALSGNAKIISANDSSGFTYRGRFSESWQAATVGYTASQKAHNALRWLVANQGVRAALPGDETVVWEESGREQTAYGGRTFLCWNPQGTPLPNPTRPLGRLRGSRASAEPSEYRAQLQETLWGWKTNLPQTAGAVIAVFDAATTGRLALTYYNELLASDFLDRLYHWDLTCSWENGLFGIQSPSLYQIANLAYGTLRGEKIETDERVLRQQMQRLMACRVDRARIPADIVRRLVERAANLQLYSSGQRQALLFTACAVVQKYHYDYDREKEKWNMQTDLQTRDRSFQFGRLLAVLEWAEQCYYRRTNGGESGKNERETNAIRMLPVYCQRPWSSYEKLYQKLRTAYLPRIYRGQKVKFEKWADEIVGILSECERTELNRPLQDTYLLGYHLQRKAIYKNSDTQTEGENENERTAE